MIIRGAVTDFYAEDDINGRPVRLDRSTHGLITIRYAHHEIHAGSGFMASKVFTHGAGASPNVLIVTPDSTKWAHIILSVISDDVLTVTVYEDSDYGGGSALTAFNRNRNSATASVLTLTIDATDGGSGKGTPIWTGAAGASTVLNLAPGSVGHTSEMILKQNTKYLIELVGASGDVITFDIDWYEHTSKL